MGQVTPGRAQAARQRDAEQAKLRRARMLILLRSGKSRAELGERFGAPGAPLSRQRVGQILKKAIEEESIEKEAQEV